MLYYVDTSVFIINIPITYGDKKIRERERDAIVHVPKISKAEKL